MERLKQRHTDRRKEIVTCRDEIWTLVFPFAIEHELLPAHCVILRNFEV
jgi:hypothetical protein